MTRTRTRGGGATRLPADQLSAGYKVVALRARHKEFEKAVGGTKEGLKVQILYTLKRTPGLVYEVLGELKADLTARAKELMTQMTYRQALVLLCPPYNMTHEGYQALRNLVPGIFPPLWRLHEERKECGVVLEDIPNVKDGAMVSRPLDMMMKDLQDKFAGVDWARADCLEATADGGSGGGGGGGDPVTPAAPALTQYYHPLPWENTVAREHDFAAVVVKEGGDGHSVHGFDGASTPHAASGYAFVSVGEEKEEHPNSPFGFRPLAKTTGEGEEALRPAAELLDTEIGRFGGTSTTIPTLDGMCCAVVNNADEKNMHDDMGTSGRAGRISST